MQRSGGFTETSGCGRDITGTLDTVQRYQYGDWQYLTSKTGFWLDLAEQERPLRQKPSNRT